MAGKKSSSQWGELFDKADKDKSGTLNEAELRDLLKQGNSNITDSEFKNVFSFFDGPGGDKKITKDEFIKGLTLIEELIQELVAIFKEYDSDGNGFLTKNELTKILKDCGQNFTDAEINEIIKQADANKDGKIGVDEFICAFT